MIPKLDGLCLSVHLRVGHLHGKPLHNLKGIRIKSKDATLLKLFHSDITNAMYPLIERGAYAENTTRKLAAAQNSLAWTGGYDMVELGGKLTVALARLVDECGTDYAKTKPKSISERYSKQIGVFRIDSSFLQVYRNADGDGDNKFSTYFDLMGNKINEVYSPLNRKHYHKFHINQHATKEEKLLSILKYFLLEEDFLFE